MAAVERFIWHFSLPNPLDRDPEARPAPLLRARKLIHTPLSRWPAFEAALTSVSSLIGKDADAP